MPRKSNKDPNKPKGRTSAYAFFVAEMKETSGKGMGFTEFSQFCSKEWKSTADEDKKKFIELGEKDRERYKKEMEKYNKISDSTKGASGGRVRRKKDKSLPKRNLSAFMFFSNMKRPKLKQEDPNANIAELAKQLGAAWKVMTKEQKAPYDEMAKKDKQRYLDELDALKKDGKLPPKERKPTMRGGKKPKKVARKDEDEDEEEEDEEEAEEEEDEEEEEDDDEDSSD